MSWLARSIANSLKLDDDAGDGDGNRNGDGRGNNDVDDVNSTDSKSTPGAEPDQHSQSTSPSSKTTATTPRGVKEDLSELTKSLTRQLWGVASFLAPPPDSSTPPPPPPPPPLPPPQISDNSLRQSEPPQQPDPSESLNDDDDDLIAGIRSDFAEIGGKFKSGISKLSSNKAVSEITKIASNFLQFGTDRDFSYQDLVGSAVGVTEEVVAFARDIAMHPETWLDFPAPDGNDFEEFDMSDVQQEHALAVEQLAPRLAALRMELCPGYMSEGCFWRIYFVLLHPRLSKTDALLLSTPQILETRAMLSQELQKRTKGRPTTELSDAGVPRSKETAETNEVSLFVPHHAESESVPLNTSCSEVVPPIDVAKTSAGEDVSVAAELETDKHPVESPEIEIVDKVVVEEEPINESKHQHSSSTTSSRVLDEKFEDDADDWLKEESLEIVGACETALSIDDDEDVSFSDLEEDDGDVSSTYKKVVSSSDTSRKISEIGLS